MKTLFALMFGMLLALPVQAAKIQVSLSSGYLHYQPVGADVWQGVDIAPQVTYSLHRQLAVFAQYSHGFPVQGEGQLNFANVQANLKVANEPKFKLFLGAGAMWYGTNTVKDWSGYTANLTGSVPISPSLAAFGKFVHGFSFDAVDPDFNSLRAGLTFAPAFAR